MGKSVTVAGTTHAGDTELDAETVDGKALREEGKPPWAGGPWVVGEDPPGLEALDGRRQARQWPRPGSAPGQAKTESAAP